MKNRLYILIALFLALAFPAAAFAAPTMHVTPARWCKPGPFHVTTIDTVWRDQSRSRDIPARIYRPDNAPGQMPVVIFSHAIAGNRSDGERWGKQWASWGIVSVHIQHLGTDTPSMHRKHGDPLVRMQKAMNVVQLVDRVKDVAFAATMITRLAAANDPSMAHVDTTAFGLAGHAFGAQTALAIAGQKLPFVAPPLADTRFTAFILFSPSVHGVDTIDKQFGSITAPLLSITGSQDESALTPEVNPSNRTLPFLHMAPGNKYLLWLGGATQMSFVGEQMQRPRAGSLAIALGYGACEPNQAHIDTAVLGTTTAFWLANLEPKQDNGVSAADWISIGGPNSLCTVSDRWSIR